MLIKGNLKFENGNMKNKIYFFLFLVVLFSQSCGEEENPIDAYYRNIPMIQGMTKDIKPKVYNIKVDLGYKQGDKKVQTELNERKDQLTDRIRSLLSSFPEEQFLIHNQPELKKKIMDAINEMLINGEIKTIYLIQLQVFEYN